MTGDQMLPLLSALALGGYVRVAREHIKLRAQRLFLHFSTENDGKDAGPLKTKLPDPPRPKELSLLIRAGGYTYLYPLLYLFDLVLIADVLVVRRWSERNKWDFDNQLLPVVLASVRVMPTFISRLAGKLYTKTDAPDRLLNYHSAKHNGIEPLGRLMVEAFHALKTNV